MSSERTSFLTISGKQNSSTDFLYMMRSVKENTSATTWSASVVFAYPFAPEHSVSSRFWISINEEHQLQNDRMSPMFKASHHFIPPRLPTFFVGIPSPTTPSLGHPMVDRRRSTPVKPPLHSPTSQVTVPSQLLEG